MTDKKPTKGEILAALNDDLQINLIRLIEGRNSFIALCHTEEDASKLNSKDGQETAKKLGLAIANSLAFEARKAIIAKNYDFWITTHSTDEIKDDFNNRYPATQCTKVITMGKNKQFMKIVFNDQEHAKTVAKNGFSIFHVRVPSCNIQIDEFVEVQMCMKCYKINEHATRHCKSTITICSECSETGHRWNECKSNTKRCINCEGDHKTTAPQCPIRKKEVNKKRQQATQNTVRAGISYSSVATNAAPSMTTNMSVPTGSILKISAAIMYAHTINAMKPGSFNTEVNNILLLNNLPQMIFPNNPPSMMLLNAMDQTNNDNQVNTTESTPAPNEQSTPETETPERERK